jgi:signal peptidase I
MATSDEARASSPWLSIWLKPRATIERVLARYSTAKILVLAGLNIILIIVTYIVEGQLTAVLRDWRALAAVIGSAAIGIALLYIMALCFRWIGRLFRGHATAAELRAVLAWGNVPTIIGLTICFAMLTLWRLSANAGVPQADAGTLAVIVQVIAALLGLWSMVTVLLMISRVQSFGFWRTVANYALGLAMFVLPLLLVRVFLLEPFNAPSGSMAPNLVVGDYFFVSKFSYGYSRYSLPLSLPLFSGRIFGSEPGRGDVVVYRQPRNPSLDFVKRVIGLPGDHVQIVDGVLQINGQPVTREPLGEYLDIETMHRTKLWREILPNGASYEVLDAGNSYLDNTEVYAVPGGRYFVIGDNRNVSMDSRMPEVQGGGTVPFENLVGRAEAIFFSRDSVRPPNSSAVRFERIGMSVR